MNASRLRRARLVLAGALVVAATALTGCLGEDGGDGGQPSRATKPTGPVEGTLTFWTAEGTVVEWWKDFVADFERKYPKAEVKFTQYSTEEYWTKVQAAFSAGDEPDIFEVSGPGEELQKYVRVNKVGNLDGLLDTARFNRASIDAYTSADGELWGVPRTSFILHMWHNRRLLADNRIDVPETWEQLLDACRALSSKGVTPIAFGNGGQDQWTATHWFDTLLYQYGGARAAVDATYGLDGASWSDPAFVEAATRLKELIDADCFPRGLAGINYSQMTSLFLRGDAAMIFTGTWFAADVEASKDKLDVGVFPLPDGPDASHSTAELDGIVGGIGGMAASRRAVEEKAALVAALLNEFGKAVDDHANETGGQLSVAADPNPNAGGLQTAFTELFESVGEVAPVTDTVVPPLVNDDYYQNAQALTTGRLSPQAFADTMAEAVERERPNLPDVDEATAGS